VDVLDVLMAQLSRTGAHRLAWSDPASPVPPGRGVRAEVLVDALIAAVTLAGSLLLFSHGGSGAHGARAGLDLAGGLLAAGATLPLLGWRRAPVGVFVLVAVVSIIAAGAGYALGVPLGPAVAVYLLAASRDEAHPWTPRTATTVAGLSAAFLAAAAIGGVPAVDLVQHAGLPWAVAWFAGERTRLRRAHIADLEERAGRAEREAEQERRLAVAEERARIARDLHDSAGHALNVIAIRAGTARLRPPQDAQQAWSEVEKLARQSVAELDQLVGALRTGQPTNIAVEAPAGLASLNTLLGQHTAAGLHVNVTTTGQPRPLGAALDQATYRILQEALTNAARHGTGAALVVIAYHDAALEVTVANPTPSRPDRRSAGGHGLIGMHERATLLGGSLQAGHRNGSFQVHAQLPYRAGRS
jgi:signal transduction histidine kinase